MSIEKTLLLGFIAGVTILLGLPIARLRRPVPSLRIMLNAVAVGILVFLVWDVLSAAWEPIDGALVDFHEGNGGLGRAAGYGLLFAGGVAVGMLALVAYERWMDRATHQPDATMVDTPPPTGASTRTATLAPPARGLATWSPAKQLSLLIAVGIGLHNATEGFGIVAPLAGETTADGQRALPSWGFLLAMGAIGGGPTFIGTAVGHAFTSEPLSVVFLTLAAGSILYVVIQLTAMAAKHKRMDLFAYGVLIGVLAGFLTDAVVTAAGV